MPVILCSHVLTMQKQEAALLFYGECRGLLENQSPYQDNLRAVAQIFARKIVSQPLSPLYCDKMPYFIRPPPFGRREAHELRDV